MLYALLALAFAITSSSTPLNQDYHLAPRVNSSGRVLQATVTGYEDCGSHVSACGFLAKDPKSPTAAMTAGMFIPKAASGTCGTCWRVTNATALAGQGTGQVPKPNGPLPNTKDGMVVIINNSCAKDPKAFIGQCNQTPEHPRDKLGSQTVLDLCRDTDAVQQFFGSRNPGIATATITEVDCSEWDGQKGPFGWH